jgi:threonine aldolase
MACLSKGLCAPVGSLLAGTRKFIQEARHKRKIMGGGMRQAGILAAAGIIGLEEHSALLAEDHRRAKKLAKGLSKIGSLNVDNNIDINMVFFSCRQPASNKFLEKTVKHFADRGILINPPEDGVFRFVTHYWIGDKEIGAVIAAAKEAFGEK